MAIDHVEAGTCVNLDGQRPRRAFAGRFQILDPLPARRAGQAYPLGQLLHGLTRVALQFAEQLDVALTIWMLSLISIHARKETMADLLVRGVDESLVRALKEQAGRHGRSAEAEHRAILAAALARPRRRSLAEALAAIPDVGLDSDFERVSTDDETPSVFG